MGPVKRGAGGGKDIVSGDALAKDDPIELAVVEIRHLTRTALLETALGVGEIVFRRIFKSDIELVRQNGPKEASFRSLCLHPALPISVSSLWRSVAMFELSDRIPLVRRSKHLTATHVQAVLGLPAREQERLLARAEREGWKPKELKAQAAAKRKGQGGRPRKLQILRALDDLRGVAGLPLSTFADRDAIKRMPTHEIETALTTLDELDVRFLELRKRLREEVTRR